MKAIIKLRIFEIEKCNNGYTKTIIFKDEKIKEYNSYSKVKRDVIKLAKATKSILKENQDFEIIVKDNTIFDIAYYNIHKEGYEQCYVNWKTLINVINEYLNRL